MKLKFQLTRESREEVNRISNNLKQRLEVARTHFQSLQEALDDLEPYYEEAENAIDGVSSDLLTTTDSPFFDFNVKKMCDLITKIANIQSNYHVGTADFD